MRALSSNTGTSSSQSRLIMNSSKMQSSNQNNNSTTISLPKPQHANTNEDISGSVQDTIYLCNFRVSVDGEWLCLKELQDLDIQDGNGKIKSTSTNHDFEEIGPANFGIIGRRFLNRNNFASTITNGSGNGSIDGGLSKSERDWVNYSRDPAAIERSNLVNICKLVVKELLEQSIRFGRQLDSDHLPLQHFFIVLEHVLRHGLRHKKGLLGPKKELWDLLQSVEKYCLEVQDVTASVRDLPTVRTHIGRARAWLRIALMQKKLADYLQALIEHRDETLAEYYEPHALMMSDEVDVIMGILVGLNVIDCNLCVKEEDLDSQQGVIDFSLYLRSSSRSSPDDEANTAIETLEGNNMTAVLDQKNYIEELNRHLNATVANLQAKVEGLTTTNALMKEDLAIARNSLLALQAENQALRRNVNCGSNKLNAIQPQNDNSDNSDFQNAHAEEKKKNEELEKELKLQVSLKAETDMAMKLLEKDIHEKQDTIISLRRQLDDIKQINLDMYRKLQECEQSLKHKTELLNKLESQKDDLNATIMLLEKKWSTDKSNMGALQNSSKTLTMQIEKCEERAARAETDIRVEREWRNSLQAKEIKFKEQINLLKSHIQQLTDENKKCDHLEKELESSKKQWSEAQTTLEELGIQLSVNKLKVQELQDQIKKGQNKANSSEPDPVWTPDDNATSCSLCQKEFSMTKRKHHCRICGQIFCKNCSEKSLNLANENGASSKSKVRVCDKCYENVNKNN